MDFKPWSYDQIRPTFENRIRIRPYFEHRIRSQFKIQIRIRPKHPEPAWSAFNIIHREGLTWLFAALARTSARTSSWPYRPGPRRTSWCSRSAARSPLQSISCGLYVAEFRIRVQFFGWIWFQFCSGRIRIVGLRIQIDNRIRVRMGIQWPLIDYRNIFILLIYKKNQMAIELKVGGEVRP